MFEGRGTITVGHITETLEPLKGIRIEAGLAHRVENTGRTLLRYYVCGYAGHGHAQRPGGRGRADAENARPDPSSAPTSRTNRRSTRARRGPASAPARSTSSWEIGAGEYPAPGFVTSDTPATSRPAQRAAIASRTVDIPTASAPRSRSIRTSATVSYVGPVRPM